MGSNKFGAKKVRADGYVFDSTLEYEYYLYLKSTVPVVSMYSKIIVIVHPKYEFIHNGILLCTYTADFEIVNPDGSKIVVDVKAVNFSRPKQRKNGSLYQPKPKIVTKTSSFATNMNMMRAFYGIEVKIIYRHAGKWAVLNDWQK